MLPRSFLYVPASRPSLFAKASTGAADAVILDLEDAVPVAEKSAARGAVAAWLGRDRQAPGAEAGAQTWVRVDADRLADDLEAVVRPGLDGIVLAKCSPKSMSELAARLDGAEAEQDLPPVPVVGLVEDAASVLALGELAAHPRLTTLGLGEVDLLAALRIARTTATADAITQLRLQVVLHCAAAGLAAPVAPTSVDFRDLDAFRRTTRELADLGFRSRTAIHPAQVPVIHEVLAPTAEAVAAARDVLDRFSAAQGGVTLDAAGRLIDAAVIRSARETLGRRRDD
ncbi:MULTISPECIES: CoA ester lyase [unclassified Amycolatopsis]|uniref:HpcH/HpaI aldolase/citrate lyase family protein n=1 Tax=unclassified Amycolatopsis TaxID=2618356 RepID=UPI001C696A8B|nr:aldolase/citrate lyase family protein [Amycolatopsis sp. DSM 110486]QYN20679.1 HpcH/HpaI aldolase/citrate lyase family protein [Amycolatopsis sp. DSM 110486]